MDLLKGKKVVLYLRRSKKYEEGEERYSITSQRDFIERIFGKENVDREFVDMSSAWKGKDGGDRDCILKALEYCKLFDRVFVVAYSSRLTRNYHFLSWFENYVDSKKIDFFIAENLSQSRFELRLRTLFAQEESEEKRKRTIMGLKAKMETSNWRPGDNFRNNKKACMKGGLASGKKSREKSMKNPKNLEVARLIFYFYKKEDKTFRGVCGKLNELGVVNSLGNDFNVGTVCRIYHRYRKAGFNLNNINLVLNEEKNNPSYV